MDYQSKMELMKLFRTHHKFDIFILAIDADSNPVLSIDMNILEFKYYNFKNVVSTNNELTFMIRIIKDGEVLPYYKYSTFETVTQLETERANIIECYSHPLVLVS